MSSFWPHRLKAGSLLAGLMLASLAAQAQELLYTNTFQGVKEGTRPPGWAIVYPQNPTCWNVVNGQFTTGNGDDFPEQDGYAIIDQPNSPSWTNYVLRCSFWMRQTTGQVLLVARWQDPQNYYLAVLSTGASASEKSYAQIIKVSDGQRIVLATVVDGEGITIPRFNKGDSAVDSRRLDFDVTGSRLRFLVDGTVLLEARDATFKKGSCGLGQRINEVFFDNVVVMQTTEQAGAAAAASPRAAAPAAPQATVAAPVSAVPGQPGALPALPSAPPSGEVYRILVAEGLTQAQANEWRSRMMSEGFIQVEALPMAGGTYGVFLGMYFSLQEAQEQMSYLESQQGLAAQRIEKISGKAAQDTMQAATASTGAGGSRLRVRVRDVDNLQVAEAIRTNLVDNHYFPVEVANVGSSFQIYCGPPFVARQDAETLADVLRQAGYFDAAVVEVAPGDAGMPTAPSTAIAAGPSVADLRALAGSSTFQPTDDELRRASSLIGEMERARSGLVSITDFQKIQRQLQQQDERIQTLLKTYESSEAQRAQKEGRIRELRLAIETAQDSSDYKRALELAREWKTLDPNNPGIDFKISSLENRISGRMFDEDIFRQRQQSQIEQKVKAAREAEQAGDLERAIALWTNIRAEARGTLYDEAGRTITRLDADLTAKAKKEESARKAQQRIVFATVGAVVVLVLAISAGLIVMMLRARKRDEELLRQVQELTVHPLKEIEEGRAPKRIEEEEKIVAALEKPDTTPAPPAPAKPARAPRAMPEEPSFAPPAAARSAEAPKPEPEKPKRPVWEAPEEAPFAVASAPAPAPAPAAFAPPPPPPAPPVSAPAPPPAPKAKPEVPPVAAPAFADPFASAPAAPSPFAASPAPVSELPVAQPSMPPPIAAMASFSSAPEIEIPPAASSPGEIHEPAVAPEDLSYVPLVDIPDIIVAPSAAEEAPSAAAIGAGIDALFDSQESTAAAMPAPVSAMPDIPPPAGEEETHGVAAASAALEAPPIPGMSDLPTMMISEKAVAGDAAGGAVLQGNVLYQQDFDDEEEGKPPKNWRGEYEYAQLVVSSQTPAPDSKRCLRFEKRTGSGSAYYSCRFPDIGGKVNVEFDVRCDDKNKYLLGFYMEKDEDFRQSIHTIIHRTNPQISPTLRIQGEPTPYTLGTWRHIKYEIDLNANAVNGYVDGQIVAKGIKLASPPKSINTLSIRDNLATTGILMIDNIKVYRP